MENAYPFRDWNCWYYFCLYGYSYFVRFYGIILVLLFPLRNWVLITITSLVLLGLPLMSIVGFDNITFNETITLNQPSDANVVDKRTLNPQQMKMF